MIESPYDGWDFRANEIAFLIFVSLMAVCLVGLLIYACMHPCMYEYEKDGETYSADYCYTGQTDEFICEVDGRRFHVNTYRRYKKGE